MKDRLEAKAARSLPGWKSKSERLKRLALFDMYLDGTIYDCLHYEFDEDAKAGSVAPKYIRWHERKPMTHVGLASKSAQAIARKLFAGRHAPSLVLEKNPDVIQEIQDLLIEANVDNEMIGLVRRGSVGSVCATFKIVIVNEAQDDEEAEPRLVMNVHKAVDCFPVFDAAKQLTKLRIAYTVEGQWFLDNEVTTDIKGEPVKPDSKYWYIQDLDKKREVFYVPVMVAAWNPVNGFTDKDLGLREISEGPLSAFEHGLNFVPAQWFVNMSGGTFPNGGCLFEPALPNIVTYDYQMSQLNLGLANAACPITVIKGNLSQELDSNNKPIPKSPSRYLQFPATSKDGDTTDEGGDAHYLESNGQGFLAALKALERVKKDAIEEMCGSVKDPDKVTTAMSGSAMELIDEEYIDLAFELRTSYGAGYLEMIQKMSRAAIIKNHPKIKNLKKEDVKGLKLAWPDMHDMGPQEYQQYMTGLTQGQEAGVITPQETQDLHRAKVDVPPSHGKAKPAPKPQPKPTSKK